MRTLTRGTKLVVASHNKGKVWEINQLIAPYGLEAVSAGSLGLGEPDETETTFRGNALIKARAAAKASGLPALADDSGLEIDVLDGAPGVYSANWAEPGRDFGLAMRRVHEAIDEKGEWDLAAAPRANFISVLCLAWPDGEHVFFEGKVFGHLVWPPRGGNGFGYDPMFVPEGHTQTFGEMEPAGKYAISHRTRAFDAFRKACLGDLSAAPVKPNAERDVEGLMAAAANISTREELKTFVKSLSADLERRGQPGVDLATLLMALEASVGQKSDEPRWRSLAKALLAATEPKAP
jgi:XTP/dITP diphosphohydrolase